MKCSDCGEKESGGFLILCRECMEKFTRSLEFSVVVANDPKLETGEKNERT